MREVVDGLWSRGFPHDALRHELLERAHGFLLASSARLPHRVQVEGPADGRRRAEHLARHVAESPQPRVEDAPHLRGQRLLGRVASRAQGREVLGDEQRQALALYIYAPREVGHRIARARRLHERRDLALVEPGGAHDRGPALARQVHGQAAEPVAGRHCLAAPADHQQQRPAPEPATEVGDRVDRGLIRGVDVVEEDNSRRGPRRRPR